MIRWFFFFFLYIKKKKKKQGRGGRTAAKYGGCREGRRFVEVEDPIPLNSFHPSISDWVIKKALEIKHYVRISCMGFEGELVALLTAIEAGYAHSNLIQFSTWLKKKERHVAYYPGYE